MNKSLDQEWENYYNNLSPTQKNEWNEYYKSIVPLKLNLPSLLPEVKYLSCAQCTTEINKIYEQLTIIHNLPLINNKKSTEYMHETLELLRQRCIQMHWRMIDINSKKI